MPGPDLSRYSTAELQSMLAEAEASAPVSPESLQATDSAPPLASPAALQDPSTPLFLSPEQKAARDAEFRNTVEFGAALGTAPFTGGLPFLGRLGAAAGIGSGASLLGEFGDRTPGGAIPALVRAAGTGARFAAGEGIGSGIVAALGGAGRFAQNQGAKALGFIQSQLRQSGPESARAVAQTALDTGVLSPLASAETMLGRAENVQAAAGQALEGLRTQIDALSPGQSVLPILRDVSNRLQDWTPGISTAPVLQRHLAETLQDIAAHADPSTGIITATGLARVKKLLADRAYANALQVPETLGGLLGPRTEVARGFVQGAEEAAAAQAGLGEPFGRAKSLYGAMARLTDPRSGTLTARVARDLGNNQVFSLSGQLGGVTGAVLGGGPGGGLGAAAGLAGTRFAYQKGNQIAAVTANRIARLAATPGTPIGVRTAAQLIVQSLQPETP